MFVELSPEDSHAKLTEYYRYIKNNIFSRDEILERFIREDVIKLPVYDKTLTRGRIDMLRELLSTHFILLWMTHKELNQSPTSVKKGKSSDINKVFLLYKELSTILSADSVCGHLAYIANLKSSQEDKMTHMQVRKILKEYDIVEYDEVDIERISKAKKLYQKISTTLASTGDVLSMVLKDVHPVSEVQKKKWQTAQNKLAAVKNFAKIEKKKVRI